MHTYIHTYTHTHIHTYFEVYCVVYNMNELEPPSMDEERIRHGVAEDSQRCITLWLDLVVYIYIYICILVLYIYVCMERLGTQVQ